MIATASGAMLAGVAEAEPDRIWFGRGGCVVERHDDGTHAVFVRGELLGVYSTDDVATRDMYIAVVIEQASREEIARAFRVSVATVGRVRTRFNEGGARAVADYGRRGGWTVRSPKLVARLVELFEKGLGQRPAHAAVAKQASYGTVHAVYREWKAGKPTTPPAAATAPEAPAQPALEFTASSEVEEQAAAQAEPPTIAAAPAAPGEQTLDAVAPATGTVVQHLGAWLVLGGLRALGFHDLARQHRRDAVAAASLRVAIDATAISLALGEGSVEGVRRIATPTAETLLRHSGGITPSWVRRVFHLRIGHRSGQTGKRSRQGGEMPRRAGGERAWETTTCSAGSGCGGAASPRHHDPGRAKSDASHERTLQSEQLVEYRGDAHRSPVPFVSSQTTKYHRFPVRFLLALSAAITPLASRYVRPSTH